MTSKQTKIKDPLNPITDEFLQDPYPTFHRLIEEAPLYYSDKARYWVLSRYEDVHSILRDLHFEKQLQRWRQVSPLTRIIPPVAKLTKSRKHWMLNLDPPEHTRMRGIVNKAFTPSMVRKMRDHIKEIAERLLEDLKGKSEFDLVAEFAFPLPVTVIAEMLGVPAEDRDRFHHWSREMTETLEPSQSIKHMMKANKSNEELTAYLRPLVEQRRKEPREDLMSALVQAEEDGHRLSEDEVLGNCILILVAGHETTVNLIGNAVRCLIAHPEQMDALRNDSELIAGAINEVLRFESPVQLVRRLAGEDMELHDREIKEHDMLVLLLGAANRDPRMFENPDRFDITRDSKKHLAFGHGIHHCLGSSLAETEGQIAVSTLLKKFPQISLKSEKIKIRQPFALRGPEELWVKTG